MQDGPVPTVLRLSDEAESAIGLARPDQIGSSAGDGCLAIVGYEGSQSDVEFRRETCSRVLEAAGASPVADAGDAWEQGRYRGPYLRDALLDAGALVETLETATFWSGIAELYAAVGDALRNALTEQGTPPLILCHVSHVYPTGASLYFTVACAQLPDPTTSGAGPSTPQATGSPPARPRSAITTASAAIIEIGLRRRSAGSESRCSRRSNDNSIPTGILNPGILIPG